VIASKFHESQRLWAISSREERAAGIFGFTVWEMIFIVRPPSWQNDRRLTGWVSTIKKILADCVAGVNPKPV
jgi:hypothetical protein